MITKRLSLKGLFKIAAMAGLLSMSPVVFAQTATTIIYVNAAAPAGGDGTSWAKAYNSLDAALVAAPNIIGSEQIWVATGTYKPTITYLGGYSGTELNLKTFNIPSNVAIYGGFKGTESLLSKRNPAVYPTILSGDLAGDDTNTPSAALLNKTDNAWHVVTIDGATNVVLDGLVITGGYAAGPDDGTVSNDLQFNILTINYVHDAGGGLLIRHGSQVQMNNVVFQYNASDSIRASAMLRDPFLFNVPLASGGGAMGVYDEGTKVFVTNSMFTNNTANNLGGHGGAITGELGAVITISNSSFANDIADRTGGAIHGKDATITLSNAVVKNSSVVGHTIGDESGGGIGVIDTNLSVSNTLFDSNASTITAGGGGIFFHAPFDDQETYTLMVTNSTFTNNSAGVVGGGGINISTFNPASGSSAVITNSVFSNNHAVDGGAVYTDGIPTQIKNSTFTGNVANFLGGAVFATNFSLGTQVTGSVDLNSRSTLIISGSAFNQNMIAGAPPIPPQFIFNIFAQALSAIFSGNGPAASVTVMTPGGGAIAAEFGSNVSIVKSTFTANTALGMNGGAILVGGSIGTPGVMNQNYVNISRSVCSSNVAATGNNVSVLDLANLGANPDGVQYVSDGSCV